MSVLYVHSIFVSLTVLQSFAYLCILLSITLLLRLDAIDFQYCLDTCAVPVVARFIVVLQVHIIAWQRRLVVMFIH